MEENIELIDFAESPTPKHRAKKKAEIDIDADDPNIDALKAKQS